MMKWEGCEESDRGLFNLSSLNPYAVAEEIHNKSPSRESNLRSTKYEPAVTVAQFTVFVLLKLSVYQSHG
jgi:hypothetical protein